MVLGSAPDAEKIRNLLSSARAEAFPSPVLLGCSGSTCFGLVGTILPVVSKTRSVFIVLQQPCNLVSYLSCGYRTELGPINLDGW